MLADFMRIICIWTVWLLTYVQWPSEFLQEAKVFVQLLLGLAGLLYTLMKIAEMLTGENLFPGSDDK